MPAWILVREATPARCESVSMQNYVVGGGGSVGCEDSNGGEGYGNIDVRILMGAMGVGG